MRAAARQVVPGGMSPMLWSTNELLFAVAFILAAATTIELGYRLGVRWRTRIDASGRDHISGIQVSLLGMLALLLSFTYAMAQSRFEVRRALVQQESGAIATAYSMTQLLPEAEAATFSGLFADYVEARLEFFEAGIDGRRIEAAIESATRIQSDIWGEVRRILDQSPESERSALLASSVAGMTDFIDSRRAALQNHVPETILVLLLLVTLVSLGFITFRNGLVGERQHLATAFFALTVAAVLTVTIDLDRPRRGAIQVSQDSIYRLLESIRADLRR
jgi:hypothetical protein